MRRCAQDDDNENNEAVIALIVARADAAQKTTAKAPPDPRFEDVREIQGDAVRIVRHKASGDELVAKTFDDKTQFEKERDNLKDCKDRKGKQMVVQLKDEYEEGLTLYIEQAEGGSLKDRLDRSPGGLSENALRPLVEKALDILLYLHGKDLSHCDFKPENMLVFGEDRNQMKVCDMESTAAFGEPRSIYATPYISSPELAKHIVKGGGDLRVSPAEDIWSLGVSVLYLLTGEHPLPTELSALARLTAEDVDGAIARAGNVSGQLQSFLKKCLAVDPSKRPNAGELKSSGWVSGAAATQFVRMSGGAMNEISTKLDAMHEDISEGFEEMKLHLGDIEQGMEAVRKTIVGLDASPVPAVFVIEMPEGSGSVEDQFQQGVNTLSVIYDPRSSKLQVLQAVANKHMKLRLICQATGEPVGEGYEIKAS